jgi:hypothetical protein
VADWPLVAAVTAAQVATEDPTAPADGGPASSAPSAKQEPRASKVPDEAGAGRHPLPAATPAPSTTSATSDTDTAATIRACLGQLRVASLERLVREVVRAKPDATRAEVLGALEGMPAHVRWFGRSIVGVQEGR